MTDTIKLYGLASRDRSARIGWLLDELGLDWERVWLDIPSREHKGEAYRAVNPFGKAPALEIDGKRIFESGAIISYLTDKHPGLAPSRGDADAYLDFLQWLFWGLSTLEMAGFDLFKTLDGPDDPDRLVDVKNRLDDQLGALDRHLADRAYVLGDSFSAVDIAVGYPLGLLTRRMDFDKYPAIEGYLSRLSERPAAQAFFSAVKDK